MGVLMQVIFIPEVTKERYAQLTGLSLDTVEGHIRRGYLKTIKRGKRRMIDLTSFLPDELKKYG